MRIHQIVTLASAAIALTACASRQVEVETGEVDAGMRWTATLARPGAASYGLLTSADTMARDSARIAAALTINIGGRASVFPDESYSQTRALVSLYGAAPGSTHPWHLHLGRCGDDKGILGAPGLYPMITIGEDGKGEAMITLPFATPTTGDYFVNVHESPSQMGRIVACGNLGRNGQ